MFLPQVDKIKFTAEDDLTEFHYEDDVLFDRPLVVRGTKKQFVPYPSINKMQTLDENNFATILKTFEDSEQFEAIYLQSISELIPVAIQEKGFFCKVTVELTDRTEEKNLFVLFDESTVAFKRLSTLLKIPYAFSKKNPAALNEQNFLTWKDKICEGKSVPLCVIAYTNVKESISHDGQIYDCSVVATFLTSRAVKKADGTANLIKKDLSDQLPILHKTLPSIVAGIKKEIPDTKVILHSVATGFKGENRGDHFVKFLLDSPDMKWKVGNDEYMPTITFRSNFTGDDKKNLGTAFAAISLIKLTCSNGAMVTLPEQYMQDIRDTFVNRLLEINKIGKEHKDYTRYFLKYSKQFKTRFADFGCQVSLHDLVNNFANTDFASLLRIFLSCKDTVITAQFAELQTSFGTVRDEDFVEVVETISTKHKFKPNIQKAVILEYLAQKRDGVTAFNNSFSIVNYVTYIAQAFDAKVQSDVERKVISFGKDITDALVHKAQYRQDTLSKYQEMLM